ncbi:hypothetical protein UCDDS831_g01097 [Diplodia seriata]|uniref:Apple domain-containing protein n=1 Tax=Diplodia seriata TaxID=420778 RepID=A0A0G2GU77_9PEZI|nr:hypothetical protein UCDDS831_g01097 [Diplodia seriata]
MGVSASSSLRKRRADNGAIYEATNNVKLKIRCNVVYPGDRYTSFAADSYEACLEACSQEPRCKGVAFVSDTGTCHLQSAIGSTGGSTDVWSAVRDDDSEPDASPTSEGSGEGRPTPAGITCGADNQQTRNSPGGKAYTIECGFDYLYGDTPGRGPAWVARFEDCLATCDLYPDCGAVAYDHSYEGRIKPCYIKDQANLGVPNPKFWGARRQDSSNDGGLTSAQASTVGTATSTTAADPPATEPASTDGGNGPATNGTTRSRTRSG